MHSKFEECIFSPTHSQTWLKHDLQLSPIWSNLGAIESKTLVWWWHRVTALYLPTHSWTLDSRMVPSFYQNGWSWESFLGLESENVSINTSSGHDWKHCCATITILTARSTYQLNMPCLVYTFQYERNHLVKFVHTFISWLPASWSFISIRNVWHKFLFEIPLHTVVYHENQVLLFYSWHLL